MASKTTAQEAIDRAREAHEALLAASKAHNNASSESQQAYTHFLRVMQRRYAEAIAPLEADIKALVAMSEQNGSYPGGPWTFALKAIEALRSIAVDDGGLSW